MIPQSEVHRLRCLTLILRHRIERHSGNDGRCALMRILILPVDVHEQLVAGDLSSNAQLDLRIVADYELLPRPRTEAGTVVLPARNLLEVWITRVVREDAVNLEALVFLYREVMDLKTSAIVDFFNFNARLSFACIE